MHPGCGGWAARAGRGRRTGGAGGDGGEAGESGVVSGVAGQYAGRPDSDEQMGRSRSRARRGTEYDEEQSTDGKTSEPGLDEGDGVAGVGGQYARAAACVMSTKPWLNCGVSSDSSVKAVAESIK